MLLSFICPNLIYLCMCFIRTYVVLSGKEVEPGVPFKVVITLYQSDKRSSSFDHFLNLPSTIHTKILRKGTVIASETRECQFGTTEIIAIKVPDHLKSDHRHTEYQLLVEGNAYGRFHGSLFLHKEKLKLRRPDVDILLETEQPLYRQGQIGKKLSMFEFVSPFKSSLGVVFSLRECTVYPVSPQIPLTWRVVGSITHSKITHLVIVFS